MNVSVCRLSSKPKSFSDLNHSNLYKNPPQTLDNRLGTVRASPGEKSWGARPFFSAGDGAAWVAWN